MLNKPDVAIVGSGATGGMLATALARHNYSVLSLEKSVVHQDRVRGEWLAPWGVGEALKLGTLDVLETAGGHYTPRGFNCYEFIPPELARERTIDYSAMVPNVRGAMTFGHPRLCEALCDATQAAGATLLRGVKDIRVTAGNPPKLAFFHDGRNHEVTPRLIVGADGRGSMVARQIDAQVQHDENHHFIAGLLIDGAEAWPDDEFCVGTEGDIMFWVFPQGGGRARLYVSYGIDQKQRFAGPDNARNLLNAYHLNSLPFSDALANARPAGPCHGYANADSWVDHPLAPGVVLIGDAAGHNDPTLGQGLSNAFRDARLIVELLKANADAEWTVSAFAPYVEERRERMRRLRFMARQYSMIWAEFSEAAKARRRLIYERVAAEPMLGLPFLVLGLGPDGLPDYAYEQDAWDLMMK
jgi:2-polyprenyl-6-methoxyphenol hydroxylase-like FAD-dependent oxidoreductase